MQRKRRSRLTWVLALVGVMLLPGACAQSPYDTGPISRTGLTTQEVVVGNGVSLNGVSLNGVTLNGVSLNGVSLNGISLNGVSLNGISLNGVSLSGSQLTGFDSSNNLVAGEAVAGTELQASLDNGESLPIRIDAVRQGEFPHADVYFYKIAFYADQGWHPMCGTDEYGVPIEALFIPGKWDLDLGHPGGGGAIDDPNALVPSCMNKSIAKCVLMGYKPWANGPNTNHKLRNHHTACVRMLRADYCGNGVAHTYNGTPINIHDGEGIQEDTVDWGHEAEWDHNGARCVNDNNVRYITSGHYSACVAARATSTCGQAPTFGEDATLLVSECAWCDVPQGR